MSDTRTALITGCTDGGIGSALAIAFHKRGFHVFATTRNPDTMASLVGKPGISLLKLDVTSDEQIALAAKQVESETGGRLDYLVNNAATVHFMPLLDDTIENAQAAFNTNVFGPLRMFKAFAPLIIDAKGAVVNITSLGANLNLPWMGSYGATKASLQLMSETLRLELQPFGVRVLSITTGSTDTSGARASFLKDFKLPTSSRYKSIEPVIKGRAQGAGTPKGIPTPEKYAAKVMPDILGNEVGIFWGPGMAVTIVKFAVNWLPKFMTDSMWRSGSGLDELAAQIKAGKI